MNYLKRIRIIWISGLALLVTYLVWQAIVPFGSISYQADLLAYNYFISELSPVERLQRGQGGEQRTITGEPVYFYLRSPRPFQTATTTITVKNPSSFMEIGLCRDKASWQFERQPLYIESLEERASEQYTIQEDGVLLWQKEKTYSSIKDFLSSPPSMDKIATYNYRLDTPFRLADYKSVLDEREIQLGARGGYTIITYSDGHPIESHFMIRSEENSNTSSQPLIITLYNEQDQVIIDKKISASDLAATQSIIIKSETLDPGPYRIEVKGGNEIITESIITTQAQMSFAHQLWLTDKDRNNLSVMTDGSYIKAQTLNPKSLQTIMIEKDSLELSETYQQFSLILKDQTRTMKQIQFLKDDIMIATDGVFAFRAEDIVNPTARTFSPALDISQAGIDYIIARYEPVGLLPSITRETKFRLSDTCLDKGRFPFLIAAPGITADQGTEIQEIYITLEGKSLLEYIQALWKRITA